ncbi:MAG: hypothetical protein AVDCRST_MAG66-4243, partial [uncultured Pseudonocardia sp.]
CRNRIGTPGTRRWCSSSAGGAGGGTRGTRSTRSSAAGSPTPARRPRTRWRAPSGGRRR